LRRRLILRCGEDCANADHRDARGGDGGSDSSGRSTLLVEGVHGGLFSHFDGYLQFDSPKAFFDHALPFVATVFEYLRNWHGLGLPSRALMHIDLRNLHSANR